MLKTRLHSREAAQQCNPAGSLRLQSMNAYDELPVPPSYQGRVAPLAYFCPVRYTPERMGYASLRRNCGCCARTPSIHSLGTADQELTTGTFNGFARSPSPTTSPAPLSDGVPRRGVCGRRDASLSYSLTPDPSLRRSFC